MSGSHVFDSGLQQFGQFDVLQCLVITDAAEHGNDHVRWFQLPLIDHELSENVQVDGIVDVEKRPSLQHIRRDDARSNERTCRQLPH